MLNGFVTVNDKVIRELGTKVDPLADEVRVRGAVVRPEQQRLYAFFKPRNVITTLRDPEGRPCVGDYLKNLPQRVFPIGRLDSDVTGLLLLTNDGDYAEHLLHPRYGAKRTYWAMLGNQPDAETLRRFENGVEVEGVLAKAEDVQIVRPALLANMLFGDVSKRRVILQLAVREGKQHFVKKLIEAAGCELLRLARVAFGPYELRGLRSGEIAERTFKRLAPERPKAEPRRKASKNRTTPSVRRSRDRGRTEPRSEEKATRTSSRPPSKRRKSD